MKFHPLRGRKVVERVRSKGKRWRGKHMQVTYLTVHSTSGNKNAVGEKSENRNAKSEPAIFAGTSASTKLHKSAVKRNRMRRRCREALRTSLLTTPYKLPTSIQLLISPRSSSLSCDFDELKTDAEELLKHLAHR